MSMMDIHRSSFAFLREEKSARQEDSEDNGKIGLSQAVGPVRKTKKEYDAHRTRED